MQVVTYYFLCFILLPYYFFVKNYAAQVFLYSFFEQKSEKIVKFFAIFSRCVSMIYEKFEKIIAKNT